MSVGCSKAAVIYCAGILLYLLLTTSNASVQTFPPFFFVGAELELTLAFAPGVSISFVLATGVTISFSHRIYLHKNTWESDAYEFVEVLTEYSSQKQVYEVVMKPVVENRGNLQMFGDSLLLRLLATARRCARAASMSAWAAMAARSRDFAIWSSFSAATRWLPWVSLAAASRDEWGEVEWRCRVAPPERGGELQP